jgi:hypothetical protein
MPYPSFSPTSRSTTAGDYPVKTFKSQSGSEVRILYGSKRTGMELDLSYDNISDSNADDFVSHYDEVKGTFNTFSLPTNVLVGWGGDASQINASLTGNQWRYAGPPSINSVRPGISSVQVKLMGVL